MIGGFFFEILIFSQKANISAVNSRLVDTNSTLKLVWLHTSHLVQKAIYCFILTRRRTAEISVLPTLTAPSTPGNVWIYLLTFEKKAQVNCNCIEGTMTLTWSVTCVSSCLPVRRGTPPAPPATRHLSRVVRNCLLLKVILEMLDLFYFVYNLSTEGFNLYDRYRDIETEVYLNWFCKSDQIAT